MLFILMQCIRFVQASALNCSQLGTLYFFITCLLRIFASGLFFFSSMVLPFLAELKVKHLIQNVQSSLSSKHLIISNLLPVVAVHIFHLKWFTDMHSLVNDWILPGLSDICTACNCRRRHCETKASAHVAVGFQCNLFLN